jgi:hypothetical protein
MSIKRCFPLLILILIVVFTIEDSWGQQTNVKFRETPKRITLVEFNHRVDRATKLLETKELSAISDADHINIMMCLNTIAFNLYDHKNKLNIRYKELETVADQKEYSRNIIKVYPKWVPNRGLGYYFPKLKMELDGTPMPYAMFEVSR